MMEEENPFDQFDEVEQEGNPFDQFDGAEAALPPDERPATLPTPRPNMFASMEDDEAAATYRAYEKHPDTIKDEEGNLIYNGQVVPKSEGNSGIADFFSGLGQRIFAGMSPAAAAAKRKAEGGNEEDLYLSERIGRGLGGGAVNVGRDAVETVAGAALSTPIPSLIEAATGANVVPDAVEDIQSSAATALEDNLPKYNPEGGVEAVSALGTEIGAGLVIGNKALAAAKAAGVTAPALHSLVTKIPKIGNILSKAIASSAKGIVEAAPVAATIDDQSDTLAVGENSLAKELTGSPILRGLKTDDENELENMVNRRLNILIDSAIIAAPLEMAADGGKKLMTFLNEQIIKPVHKAFSKDAQNASIMNEIMDAVGLAADPANANSEKALRAKERVVQLMKTPEFREMQINVGKEGVDDIAFKRDTASVVERGLAGDTSEEADAIRNVFRESRKQAKELGGTRYQQTGIASERPVRAADKLLEQSEEVFGGEESVKSAKQGIQKSVLDEVGRGTDEVIKADQAAREAEAELPQKFREGPLGESIVEAEMGGFAAGRQRRNRVTDDLLETERSISEEIDTVAAGKWKNIPEGVNADPEELTTVLADASEFLDKETLRKLQEAGFEFDPEMADDMVVDFKKLQEIRSPLSAEIDRRMRGAHQGVKQLTRIRDALNKVEDSTKGVPELEDAVGYERTVRGPERKSGLPGELRKIRRNRDIPIREDAERAALHKALTSDQPKTVQHFVKYISDHRPEQTDLIVDYAYADAADKVSKKIIAGEGLTSINPDEIVAGLEPYRQALNSNSQYSKKVEELDNFIAALQQSKGNIKELQRLAKEKAKDIENLKQEIYKVRYPEFFSENGTALPEGYTSLKQLYTDPQATGADAAGRLDDVIQKAKDTGDPAVLDGMKSAYLKLVRDEVFNKAPNAASQKGLSAEKTDDFLRGTGKANLRLVGQKLFEGQDSTIIQALDEILQPALDATVSGKSGASKMQKGNIVDDAKEAVGAAVRVWYGPLTRKGTQINTVVGKLLNHLVENKKAEAALDAIMSDPDGFLKAYDQFTHSTRPSKERIRQFSKWMIMSGVYNEGDANQFEQEALKAEQDRQTEEALPDPNIRKVN
jgi:hypothetical protein